MPQKRTSRTRSRAPGHPTTVRRRSREEWLEAALGVLSQEGEGRIRVRQLAAALGVTTGSFYWHFESRAEFLRQILEYWLDHYTVVIARIVASWDGTPRERLERLGEAVIAHDGSRYDVAVRAWAAHEVGAAEALRRADAIRLRTVGGLFRELGFRGRALTFRARAYVTFVSMHALIGDSQPDSTRVVQIRELVDLLCRDAPGDPG